MVNGELGIRNQDVELRFCPDTQNLTQFPCEENNELWICLVNIKSTERVAASSN